MDLREKFIRDFFDVMNARDKATTKFDSMSEEDRRYSIGLGEDMVKKGWHFDAEKGK